MIKIVIAGFRGKMGTATTQMVLDDSRFELVGVVSVNSTVTNMNELKEYSELDVPIFQTKEEVIKAVIPDVWIDFTTPDSIYETLLFLVEHDIHPVIGTTGLSSEEIESLRRLSNEKSLGGMIAPNFAIGAVLMTQFAIKAAEYFPDVEIMELHHNQKLDAPSGTALNTAQAISKVRKPKIQGHPEEKELIEGARGADFEGMKIHSVRLPGLIAHQQVQFGSLGEGLTIRHDSYERTSFMAGVALSCEKVMTLNEIVYGLECIL